MDTAFESNRVRPLSYLGIARIWGEAIGLGNRENWDCTGERSFADQKKLQPGNKPFPQLQFQSIAIALLAACHFSRHPARTTGTETAGTGFLEETAVSFHPVFADIETLQLLFGRNANPDRRFEN